MALKANLILIVICGLAVILLASCSSVDVHQKSEPRPETEIADAPSTPALACGFRLKRACGYDLLYDAEADVYAVVGMPEGYYHDGYFYSLFGDGWQISTRGNGGWRPVALGLLPSGLQKKVYAKMYARILTNAQPQSNIFAKTPF